MERYLAIKHPWVDSSLAPLYRVTFPASGSDDKLLSYCRAVESWSTQVTHPVAWLMDLSHVAEVSAHQRAMVAKYMRGMEAFDRRFTKGTALILPSALMRGVVTAIFWLYDPQFLHRTFAVPSEGLVWLREVLCDAGVEQLGAASVFPSARPSAAASTRPMGASESGVPGERISAPPTSGGATSHRGR